MLVCGYYNRDNYGDDLFVDVLAREWSQHDLRFSNIEQLTPLLMTEAKLIVLGGGDLLQDYFLDKLQRLLPYKRCPIYAVGVSVPFPNVVDSGKLDLIDRFWCRFQADVELLTARYGSSHVQRIPDLALLTPLPRRLSVGHNRSSKQRIGLCLSMSLVRHDRDLFITQIRNLIQRLLLLNYEVNWLAFNSDSSEVESDVLLYELLPKALQRQVKLYREATLLPALVQVDLLVASRFHAHVLASLANVPVISLVLTRKIARWVEEHGWQRNAVQLPRQCQYCTGLGTCQSCQAYVGYPTQLPLDEIMRKISRGYKPVYNSKADIRLLQQKLCEISHGVWLQRTTPPYPLANAELEACYQQLQPSLVAFGKGELSVNEFSDLICLSVTRDPQHKFNYGLRQQLTEKGNDYDLRASLDYMLRTHRRDELQWSRGLVSQSNGLLSLTSLDQHRLAGNHRSGWSYALDLLTILHNENAIAFDGFVDRTFGWQYEQRKALGLIPYQRPWIGFIHHPGIAVYSDNDCQHLLQRELFQQSLQQCQALFVMASDLKEWLISHGVRVPIHVIYHPTETVTNTFSWKKFKHNNRQRLVTIGAWLRDPYAIFSLRVKRLQKALLKCKDMEGYLLERQALVVARDPVVMSGDGGCRDVGASTTPFIASLQARLDEDWASVELLDRVDNKGYDQLLSQNIVFLPLVEAVACNTLIECIVRNTPVIVKRLPATLEYLGADYPLFYDDYEQAERLADDYGLLRAAYHYLKAMDKGRLSAGAFIRQIEQALRG